MKRIEETLGLERYSVSLLKDLQNRVQKNISLTRAIGEGVRKERALSGQGTTEYAILVGVLVVIAILAITVFRPKIQELWDAISSGINGL